MRLRRSPGIRFPAEVRERGTPVDDDNHGRGYDHVDDAIDNAEERAALRSVCAELPELLAEREQQPPDRQELTDRIRREAVARRPILPLLAQLVGTSRAETVRSLGSGLPGVSPG